MSGENVNRKIHLYINDREIVNAANSIDAALRKVRHEKRNLVKGTEDYDKQLKLLLDTEKKLIAEQTRYRSELAQTKGILGQIKDAIGPVASGFLTAFSISTLTSRFTASLQSAVKTINDFEQSAADLSAITGATGKDLNYLKNQAIDLGKETIGGATAVVEAYKLIASAKPELLSNVKALNDVTEATILLSKASGMDLPKSATALTDAMNQFGVDAKEATFFVDALANGAKYGAAEIPDVTEALLKFGAVARSSNIDIKESTALIELLAENGLKGAEAGTALRNILLKLSAPDALPKEAVKEFNRLGISMSFLKDNSIPFQQKMEALKPLVKDNASIVKIFGNENATAAINVLSHTDRLKELTSKMGEVGTASEQAAIKMDTVQNKTELMNAKYDSLILSINKGTGPISNFFKFFIDGASNALDKLIRLNTSWSELFGKAKSEGQKQGSSAFMEQFNNLAGTGSDEDIAKSIKSVAEKNYKMYEKQYEANAKKLAEFKKNAFAFVAKYGINEDDLNEEKEKLTKSLNEQAAIINAAREKINPKKTSRVETEKNTTATTGLSDDEKKKAEKQLQDARKHSEDLRKQKEASEKQLLETQRAFQDINLQNMKDGYDKELALINNEYDRKLEDIKIKIAKEQEEIDKLQTALKDPKNKKSDVALIQQQIDNRIEAQRIYSDTSVSLEQTRLLKIAAVQEKYLLQEFKRADDANSKALQKLQTQQNEELASITDLQSAKEILKGRISDEELSEIKTLEAAKKEIVKQNLIDEYNLQLEYLTKVSNQYKELLALDMASGFQLLSDEERETLKNNLDEVANKVSEFKLKIKGEEDDSVDPSKDISSLSGLDILGFNPQQWQEAFDNLDSWASKLEMVGTVVGGLKNAFATYFQFVDASDRRSLQKFEANSRKKQKELSDQLEKGYITQEIYNARKDKLDNDLAKKRAELEYKQAKREKLMNIASIISNTAMGVSKALAQGGFVLGIPWAAIVGALGAVQLAAAIAQPLPSKEGFFDGGYTGDGPERNSPGPVHYEEYVVPRKVLFSDDPIVPSIVGYLEAKRTGKVTAATSSGDYATGANNSQPAASSVNDSKMAELMDRVATVLETIEEEGIPAFLVNDLKTAKDLRKKQRELENLENQTKR